MKSKLKIAQLSDLHICSNQDAEMHGEKPYTNLQKVLNSIMENIPDIILLTGDIAEDGSEASYHLVGKAIGSLNIPTYAIPGNHDDLSKMLKILPLYQIQLEKNLELNKTWQVIFLNTVVPHEHWGFLEDTELSFLEVTLQNLKDKKFILAMHHHPTPIHSVWMDKYMLRNNQTFFNIINNYNNIHYIVFGHVHQEVNVVLDNIRYLSAPSTYIQFSPGAKISSFAKEILPGYRWFTIDEFNLNTGIHRIKGNHE